MGGNIGGLQGVIKAITGRAADPQRQGQSRRPRRPGVRDVRGTVLGGIQPFGGGGQRRGGGLFGGPASTAAQQTFGT